MWIVDNISPVKSSLPIKQGAAPKIDMSSPKVVIHVSWISIYTVNAEQKAGMPSLYKAVQEFVRRGWRVIYVFPALKRLDAYEEDGIEFYPIYFPWLFSTNLSSNLIERARVCIAPPLFIIALIFKLLQLYKRVSPDVLYAHGPWAAIASTFAKKFHKTPVVARLYGLDRPSDLLTPFPPSSLFLNWLYHVWIFKSDVDLYIVTEDGTYGRQVLLYWGLANRSLALRNGVDYPASATSSDIHMIRLSLGLELERSIITYVGRLVGWKRVDRIIKVAQRAKCRGLPWVFVLVGDGGSRQSLEEDICQFQLEETVKLVGSVSHEKVWDYLQCSNVFLNLHDLSSLSNTLLEALRIGTPVVCSHKGDGIEDLVVDGNTGKLVENPDDPDEVIEKLQAAMHIPQEAVLNSIHLGGWEERFEIEFNRISAIIE